MARPSILTPELLERANGYLKQALDNVELTDKGALAFVEVKLPSIADFALYLGVNRDTIYSWSSIDSPQFNDEFSDIVKEVNLEQEKRLINSGLGGLYAPKVVGMILSKHGYSEKVSTDITTNGQSINPDVSALTKQLNELHRGTGISGDGGIASPVGKEAQDKE